jgi:DHA1 family multidrug resistance protein-like MFS transporter
VLARFAALRLGRPRELWQRNLLVMTGTAAVTHTGFDLVNPFLPLYVIELGAQDPAEVVQWSGALIGISPFITGFVGPFWGTVADRYGRKRIMLFSIVTFGTVLSLMATSQTVVQLFVFRALIGLFGGFTNLAMVLATTGVPRERVGQVVGTMQSVNFVALALIPPLGGVVRDIFGVRFNCVVGGLLCFIGLGLVALLYRTPEASAAAAVGRRREKGGESKSEKRGRAWPELLRLPGFAETLALLFCTNFVERSFFTVVPIFVTLLLGGGESAGLTIGLILGAGALATALSSTTYGRLSGSRPIDRLLIVALSGGMVALAVLLALPGVESLAVMRVAFALVAGGAITLAFTRAGREVPAARAATGYSLLSSSGMMGGAIAPFLVGAIGGINIMLVFVADILLYGTALGVVIRSSWRRRASSAAAEKT